MAVCNEDNPQKILERQGGQIPRITLLDYGAGNVRSVVNALESLGETVVRVNSPADIEKKRATPAGGPHVLHVSPALQLITAYTQP
ncbi:MAG: hypothetical protein D3917_11835, partial [Candidatus Electrothrix sp. AX5]|nr:hypothetical protein [Candidatus Electrothrix sp. AX5]